MKSKVAIVIGIVEVGRGTTAAFHRSISCLAHHHKGASQSPLDFTYSFAPGLEEQLGKSYSELKYPFITK